MREGGGEILTLWEIKALDFKIWKTFWFNISKMNQYSVLDGGGLDYWYCVLLEGVAFLIVDYIKFLCIFSLPPDFLSVTDSALAPD